MHLLTRRSQRDDGWFESSITFALDVRLELLDEEQYLFDKCALGDRTIYNSESFLQHLKAADEAREEAAKEDADLWSVYYNSFVALYHNLAGKLELQLTLRNLVDGTTIETADLEELLWIEQLIQDGVEFIAQYHELALTYDSREALHEY